jgi:hypothetical protein
VDTFTPEVAAAVQDVVSNKLISALLMQFGEHLCLPGGVDGRVAKYSTN